MADVWADLYLVNAREQYREAVIRVNRYLMARHDVTSSDPAIRGGVAGSWPVHAEYGRHQILNWATKFFLDGLLAQERITAAERQAETVQGASA